MLGDFDAREHNLVTWLFMSSSWLSYIVLSIIIVFSFPPNLMAGVGVSTVSCGSSCSQCPHICPAGAKCLNLVPARGKFRRLTLAWWHLHFITHVTHNQKLAHRHCELGIRKICPSPSSPFLLCWDCISVSHLVSSHQVSYDAVLCCLHAWHQPTGLSLSQLDDID